MLERVRFVNPNQYQQLARSDGKKYQEDIWDMSSSSVLIENNKSPDKLVENFEHRELNPRQEKIEKHLSKFCQDVIRKYKDYFLSILHKKIKEDGLLSKRIVDYLKTNNLIYPSFESLVGEGAKKWLQEMNLPDDINQDEILLIFQLPKPLKHFWWKGSNRLSNGYYNYQEEGVDYNGIPWGISILN